MLDQQRQAGLIATVVVLEEGFAGTLIGQGQHVRQQAILRRGNFFQERHRLGFAARGGTDAGKVVKRIGYVTWRSYFLFDFEGLLRVRHGILVIALFEVIPPNVV